MLSANPRTSVAAIIGAEAIDGYPFEAVGALIFEVPRPGSAPHTTVCTGTLMASDAVVTAAHCQPLSGAMEHGGRLSFCFTARLWPDIITDASHACVPVSQFLPHPQYRRPGPWDTGLRAAHDVALVVLARPVPDIEPAVLLATHETWRLEPGLAVVIAGFGAERPGERQQPGLRARRLTAHTALGDIDAYEMVVSPPPAHATKTYGDSGGPTFVPTSDGPRLAGVTSRLAGLYGQEAGTIDTRLDAVADWLNQTLQALCAQGSRSSCATIADVAKPIDK